MRVIPCNFLVTILPIFRSIPVYGNRTIIESREKYYSSAMFSFCRAFSGELPPLWASTFRVEEGKKKKKGRGKKASTMSLYRRSLFSPSTQVFSILATRLREKFDSSRNFTDVNLLHLTFEDGEALRWMERRWTSIEKDGKSFDPRGITIRTVITKSRIRIGGKVSCRRDATSGAFLRPLATADNSAKDTAERVERTRSIHDSDVF